MDHNGEVDIRQVANRRRTCPTPRELHETDVIIRRVFEEWDAERSGPDGRRADVVPAGDRWAIVAYWYGDLVGYAHHKTVGRAHRAGVAYAQRARIPGQPRKRRKRRKRAGRRNIAAR